MQQKYLALEDFHQNINAGTAPLIGERLASSATMANHGFTGKNEAEKEELMRMLARLERQTRSALEGRAWRWELCVSEKGVALDLLDALEDSVEGRRGNEIPKGELTGEPDLDENFARQNLFGGQLEDLRNGEFFKEQIKELMSPEGYKELDPLIMPSAAPLWTAVEALEADMAKGLNGGLAHPHLVRGSVGGLFISIENGAEREMIPLIRMWKHSGSETTMESLEHAVKEHSKELRDELKNLKRALDNLPEGWPNDKGCLIAERWKSKRFQGDADLAGSDFFEGGSWMRLALSESPRKQHVLSLLAASQRKEIPAQEIDRGTSGSEPAGGGDLNWDWKDRFGKAPASAQDECVTGVVGARKGM